MYVVVKNASGAIVAQPSPIATLGTGADQNFSINYTLVKNTNLTIDLFANLADDGQDDLAGVNGATDAIDATDAFDTVFQVSGTSLVSGAAVTGGDGATTVVGQAIAFAAATITVSKDASAPVTAIAYDNQNLTTLAAKFTTVTAGFKVTDVTVTVGASADTVVQNVMLYDGATLLATAPLSTATTAVFSGLTWEVPANTNKVLTVKLQLGTVGPFAGSDGRYYYYIYCRRHRLHRCQYIYRCISYWRRHCDRQYYVRLSSTPTVTYIAPPNNYLGCRNKSSCQVRCCQQQRYIAWKQVLFDITKSAAPTIASVTLWDVTGGGNTSYFCKVFQNGTVGVATTCVADNTVCELY